jgi:hypothetical protein
MKLPEIYTSDGKLPMSVGDLWRYQKHIDRLLNQRAALLLYKRIKDQPQIDRIAIEQSGGDINASIYFKGFETPAEGDALPSGFSFGDHEPIYASELESQYPLDSFLDCYLSSEIEIFQSKPEELLEAVYRMPAAKVLSMIAAEGLEDVALPAEPSSPRPKF